MRTLKKLENEFLKLHYEKKYSLSWRTMKKSVVLPPNIPEQEDGWNCGVHMLEMAR